MIIARHALGSLGGNIYEKRQEVLPFSIIIRFCSRFVETVAVLFNYIIPKYTAVLSIGRSAREVGAVWFALIRCASYVTMCLERHQHALATEHILPLEEACLTFVLHQTHIGRKTEACDGDIAHAVQTFEYNPSFATIENSELAVVAVKFCRFGSCTVADATLRAPQT